MRNHLPQRRLLVAPGRLPERDRQVPQHGGARRRRRPGRDGGQRRGLPARRARAVHRLEGEPDALAARARLRAHLLGDLPDDGEAAPRRRGGAVVAHDGQGGVVVVDADPDGAPGELHTDSELGPGVEHGVGDELARGEGGVVDQVVVEDDVRAARELAGWCSLGHLLYADSLVVPEDTMAKLGLEVMSLVVLLRCHGGCGW